MLPLGFLVGQSPAQNLYNRNTLVEVPWRVDCFDEDLSNGYMNQGYCVPGMITRDAWYFRGLYRQRGVMSSYAPGVMESVIRYRGYSMSGMIGGAAIMSCDHLGDQLWILIEERWVGPFRIVDCSARHDMYVNILHKNLVVEVGYKTTQKLGATRFRDVTISIHYPPKDNWRGVNLAYHWLNTHLEFGWKPAMGGQNEELIPWRDPTRQKYYEDKMEALIQ